MPEKRGVFFLKSAFPRYCSYDFWVDYLLLNFLKRYMNRALLRTLIPKTSLHLRCAQQVMKGPKNKVLGISSYFCEPSLLIPNHLDDISRCIIYKSNVTYVTEFSEIVMPNNFCTNFYINS